MIHRASNDEHRRVEMISIDNGIVARIFTSQPRSIARGGGRRMSRRRGKADPRPLVCYNDGSSDRRPHGGHAVCTERNREVVLNLIQRLFCTAIEVKGRSMQWERPNSAGQSRASARGHGSSSNPTIRTGAHSTSNARVAAAGRVPPAPARQSGHLDVADQRSRAAAREPP
jgi:hypothetical protein